MLSRCRRCGRMYEAGADEACVYHPGKFHGGHLILSNRWSCCHSEVERSEGCRTAALHLQCAATEAALDQAGGSAGLRRRGSTDVPVAKGVPIVEGRPCPTGAPDDAAVYIVSVADTLSSIALRHRMTVGQLKRWNKMLSPSVYAGQRLYVAPAPPPTPEAERAEALRLVCRRGGVGLAEAAYYLDECGGAVEAIAALKADGEEAAARLPPARE